MKTAIFKIDGMHCDGCARTVEALVSAEPGVRKASVSFKEREARVLFDPNAVSEDRLVATIQQAGADEKGPPRFASVYFACATPFVDDSDVSAAQIATVFNGGTNNGYMVCMNQVPRTECNSVVASTAGSQSVVSKLI